MAKDIMGNGLEYFKDDDSKSIYTMWIENKIAFTVTVVQGFCGIGQPEKEKLAKEMQKACGTGGTVKEGRIEIQGDKREEVARILRQAGFAPVFAGG